MSEPSPDPIVPHQPTPDSSSSLPQPPVTPPPAGRPQRDVQPRRFGVLAVGIFFVFLLIVVIVGAMLAGGTGAGSILDRVGIQADIRGVVFTFINVIYGIAAMVAMVFMLVGGFRAATSLGDPHQAQRGRRTLVISLVTLIFLFGTYVVFYNILGAPPPPPPPAKLTMEVAKTEGEVPFEVLFNVKSSYPDGTTYSWDFGDGTTANPPSGTISHTYDKPNAEGAPYEAILTVTSEGKTDTFSKKISVSKSKATAAFIMMPEDGTGPAPLTVQFDASPSKPGPGAGQTLTYLWNFGDAVDKDAKPEKQLMRMQHKYVKEGTYTAQLTVTDDQNQTATVMKEITVESSMPTPTARVTTSPPLRDADPTIDDPKNPDALPTVSGIAPLQVSFSGSASESPNGKIEEYTWTYGDGSDTGRGRAQTHLYAKIGVYVAELAVTDVDGQIGRTRILVDVQAQQRAPVARIDTAPRSNGGALIGSTPFKVAFDGTPSTDEDGKVMSYRWDFGDKTPAVDGDRIDHTFTRAGDYIVSLVVEDDTGLASKPVTLQVKVNPGICAEPKASVTTNPTVATGVLPLVVEFDGSASTFSCSTIVNYSWSFGDNSPRVSSGAKVTHIYKVAGLYTAELTVTGADGKTARATTTVSIQEPPPRATISADRTVTTAGTTITFRGDGSLGNIQTWYWDFGDGIAESGRTVKHAYAQPNFYTVKLIVTDVHNQTDTTTLKVEIN